VKLLFKSHSGKGKEIRSKKNGEEREMINRSVGKKNNGNEKEEMKSGEESSQLLKE